MVTCSSQFKVVLKRQRRLHEMLAKDNEQQLTTTTAITSNRQRQQLFFLVSHVGRYHGATSATSPFASMGLGIVSIVTEDLSGSIGLIFGRFLTSL